jgi:hypothetical protein
MKNGYRIVDTDTHVVPAMELLYDYGSEDLKSRWDELSPYLQLNANPKTAYGDWERPNHTLSVAPYQYTRRLGEKIDAGEKIHTGKEAKSPLAAAVSKGAKASPEPGVSHDNAPGRLRAMDEEGTDVHLLIPGTFAMASTALDTSLSVELLASYNRYIVDYASADPTRVKPSIQVHGAEYTGYGIRVNAIVLGGGPTPMADRVADEMARVVRGPEYVRPPRGVAAPFEEFGRLLTVLCTEEARSITGAVIPVDRGISAGLLTSTMIYLRQGGLLPSGDLHLLAHDLIGFPKDPTDRP